MVCNELPIYVMVTVFPVIQQSHMTSADTYVFNKCVLLREPLIATHIYQTELYWYCNLTRANIRDKSVVFVFCNRLSDTEYSIVIYVVGTAINSNYVECFG